MIKLERGGVVKFADTKEKAEKLVDKGFTVTKENATAEEVEGKKAGTEKKQAGGGK